MTEPAHIEAAITELLGPNAVLKAEDGKEYLEDINGPGTGSCLLIVKPATTQELASLMALCREHGISVIPQGGNTNVCRMAIPMAIPTEDRQTILVSLKRMNRIIEIDETNATVTVEAGCLMQVLQEAVAEKGMLFAPDWGARGSASVGGAVSTNGGGLNVLRYGTTREQVLGMEVVLPDGRIWDGLRSLTKDNSGFDLKHVFIGSEGTIGLITRLVFKLHPAMSETQSMFVSLTDISRLPDLAKLVRRSAGDRISGFELLPALGLEHALKRYPDLRRPVDTVADWYVLLRLSDNRPVTETLLAIFEAGLESGVLSDGVIASNLTQETGLWEIREQMIPHQYFRGLIMIKWDVSVPPSQIADFIVQGQELVQKIEPTAVCYAVSHIGDGNVHYSVYLDPALSKADRLTAEISDRVDELIWSLNGSVVAEHGVGALFRDRLRQQKSNVEYELQQAIKSLFDPDNRMNPGKMIAPFAADSSTVLDCN